MRILMILVPAEEGATPLTIEQVMEPYYLLLDRGFEIVLTSPGGGSPVVVAKKHDGPAAVRFKDDPRSRDALSDTLGFNQICPGDFEAAIQIGLFERATTDQESATRLKARLIKAGKPVIMLPAKPVEAMITVSTLLASAIEGEDNTRLPAASAP